MSKRSKWSKTDVECPSCGERTGKAGFEMSDQGPFEGLFNCPRCSFMWAEGEEGRGVEWWNDIGGWIRAPEGTMTVFGKGRKT